MSDSTDIGKIQEFNSWYNISDSEESKWRDQAKEDKDFYWSRQWEAKDKDTLKKEGRPCLTFNEIKSTVNLISGNERQNRMDVRAFNRVGGSDEVAQILSILIKDIETQCNAPFEYSRQFLDGLIEARGFVGFDISFENDILNGDIVVERKKPLLIHIDPGTSKYDLSDAEYAFEEGWFTRKKLSLIYPEKTGELESLQVTEADKIAIIPYSKDYVAGHKESGKLSLDKYKIKVKTCWYRTWEKRLFLYCEETAEIRPAEIQDKEKLLIWVQLQSTQGLTWRIIENVVQPVLHKTVYVGNTLLEDMEEPLGRVNKIPIIPYFAYWDDDENQSVVTDLKDPQREVNKRYSQFLHILNTTANSGWLAEENAILNMAEWKRDSGKAGFIGLHKQGKKPDRIEPAGISQGHIMAERMNEDNLKKISGVNVDLLGQFGARGEPGIVLQLRQRQGMVTIEQLYDNWRYTRLLQGQMILDLIQKARSYTTEEVQNIIGRENIEITTPKTIERILSDLNVGRYEVKIDMQTESPTIRMANFYSLIELAKTGVPIPPDALLEAYPGTLANKDEIIKRIRKQMGIQEGVAPGPVAPGEEGVPSPQKGGL